MPKIRKVRRPYPAFIFPAFMGFPFPIQAGGPPPIHKRRPPCQQSPTPARLSPYAGAVPSHVSTAPVTPYACADPHGSADSPHASTAPPYNRQAPKIPTLVSTRPAFPAPQIRHPRVSTNSLRRLLARYHMSRRGTLPTRPAAGAANSQPVWSRKFTGPAFRSTQIYIQPNSLKFQRPTTGGHGRRRRRGVAATSTTGGGQHLLV